MVTPPLPAGTPNTFTVGLDAVADEVRLRVGKINESVSEFGTEFNFF